MISEQMARFLANDIKNVPVREIGQWCELDWTRFDRAVISSPHWLQCHPRAYQRRLNHRTSPARRFGRVIHH